MGNCKDCTYYDNSNTYTGTGYCMMISDYVKEDDTCEEFEE